MIKDQAVVDGVNYDRTILIAEDEALLAIEVEDIVIKAGYSAIVVSGHDIPADIEKFGFLAAIVDLNLMDGYDGRDLIKRLRAFNRKLPVLVMTGYSRASDRADLRGLGGPTARVEKPINQVEFVHKLRCAINSQDGIAC